MNPIQVRTLNPGTMPKASEWNALVAKARRGQPSQAGFDWQNGTSYKKKPNPFRQQTIFYTPVDIPAYSVFPVKVRTNSGEPFQVCEFDKTEIADYADGFWGTNGRFSIPKETSFYGWLLDENHDDPIAVYGNPNIGDECGLSERAEFKADPDAQGMIITGVFSTGVYYVRKMNRFPDFFATLNEDYTVEDGTYTSVTLEDPETFIGENTIDKVYPAWNIDPETQFDADTRVIVRFDTKRGKWFFFKPVNAIEGKLLDVSGGQFQTFVNGEDSEHGLFFSELLSKEFVGSCRLMAWPQKLEITGSETRLPWVKYPTALITPHEMPLWVGYVPDGNSITQVYQYLENDIYHIVQNSYYGLVFFDGTGTTSGSRRFWFPKYRPINDEIYWQNNFDGYGGDGYIYHTVKWFNSSASYSGWTKGTVLGKWLNQNDTQPFTRDTDLSGSTFQEQIISFIESLGYSVKKPEWTSNSQFGIYTSNDINDGPQTVQFGCGRWEASDGRTIQDPYYFVHVCDGTVNKWKGKYVCQAFNQEFNGLIKALVWNPDTSSSSWKYIIGNWDSGPGCYYSDSAPSTSAAVTFTYREGVSGLKATLKYVSTSNGSETWEMKCGPAKATYLRDENDLENLVYQSATGGDYYFRNITKSNSTWTAAGVDGTVGTLVFSGADLSKESENNFLFNHSITLTLKDYVQGSEKKYVYICSPGVVS